MEIKEVKWGIMGTGNIASTFAKALANVPGAVLHSVCSRSADTARAFAAEHGFTHAVEGYENIVHGPAKPDVVYVASPHTLHPSHTLMALQSGVAVLCEKPMAANFESVVKMVLQSRDNNVFLMEAMWTRFLPSFLKAEEWIAGGRIGTPSYIKADFGYRLAYNPSHRIYDLGLGGGALLDIGVYPLFLALHFFGIPSHIQAATRKAPSGADAHTVLQLGFAGEKMAHLSCSVDLNTNTEAIVYGDKGSVHIKGPWFKPSSVELYEEGQLIENFDNTATGSGYEYEAHEVMRCLAAGEVESPLYPHRFSLQMAETVEKIKVLAGLKYPAEL